MNIFKKSALAMAAVSLIALSGCAGVDQNQPRAHTNYEQTPLTSMNMQNKLDNTVLIETASVKQTQEISKMKPQPKNPPPILGDGATMDGSGSGWFRQGSDKIVTAEHVIDGEDVIQVILHDGRKFRATVVYKNKDLDIAEIQLVNPDNQSLPEGFQVCKVSPQSGDHITLIGNPLGFTWMVHEGVVANPVVTKNIMGDVKIDAMAVDLELQSGFSGGPIITDDNCVAGIADFIFYEKEDTGPEQALYFVTTTDTLNKFISQVDNPNLRPVIAPTVSTPTSVTTAPAAPIK